MKAVYLIFQILHKLAKVQGFENEKSYIQTYLPYLIHQWLCLQYSMEDFPFQLAFCDSKHSFYRLLSFYICKLYTKYVVVKLPVIFNSFISTMSTKISNIISVRCKMIKHC